MDTPISAPTSSPTSSPTAPDPASGDHPRRDWLLGVAMLTLARLPEAVLVCALYLSGLRWVAALLLGLAVRGVARTVSAARGPLPGRAVRPQDEPALAELVRDVAGRLGFHQPLLVRVVPTVQAALGRTRIDGVRTPVLLLGLPLLRNLTEAELASVIAHELAHERHLHDRRHGLLRFARAQLAERLEGRFRPLAPFAAPLLRASRSALWRAETAADADAARIAGSEATAGALHRVGLLDAAFEGLGERWLSGLARQDAWPEDFYDAFDAAVSDPHVARRAARAAADADAVDPYGTADHPPLDRRAAALPAHAGPPFGSAVLTLRTGAAVEEWCVRELAGLDREPDEEPHDDDVSAVRLLGLPHDRLRELGFDTRLDVLYAVRRDSSTRAAAAVLDALADGTGPLLARRLEPALRWAPATVRPALTRGVLANAASPAFAEALCAAGWTYSGRWLTTVVTPPDGGSAVDVHELLDDALRSGDLEPLRTLWASAGPKEWDV
ncbi:M48 family metalloprotease [Streptomyces sp. NBC_00199]|uniref:M48 family metalloprotease n=1 Tax=Streptomyces sp. NBC_00199 TaxID=2975678 RepID=UPI00224CEB02|nr:M48 family metalloprotease [Streptomyces sp. NBC_00199]MCX5268465.1 M48 family metalloprotease [Streptomyces sp. NBC_00199]